MRAALGLSSTQLACWQGWHMPNGGVHGCVLATRASAQNAMQLYPGLVSAERLAGHQAAGTELHCFAGEVQTRRSTAWMTALRSAGQRRAPAVHQQSASYVAWVQRRCAFALACATKVHWQRAHDDEASARRLTSIAAAVTPPDVFRLRDADKTSAYRACCVLQADVW